MKTIRKTSTALCFVLLVIVQAALVKSEDKKFQCKGHDITISEKQLEGMKKCGEKIGVKSMEEMTPDKIPCFAKCVMEMSELVDGEGKPHKENIMKHIDTSVPKEMQETYKKAVEKCLDDHGGSIKPADASCQSYTPLAMCAAAAVKSICLG